MILYIVNDIFDVLYRWQKFGYVPGFLASDTVSQYSLASPSVESEKEAPGSTQRVVYLFLVSGRIFVHQWMGRPIALLCHLIYHTYQPNQTQHVLPGPGEALKSSIPAIDPSWQIVFKPAGAQLYKSKQNKPLLEVWDKRGELLIVESSYGSNAKNLGFPRWYLNWRDACLWEGRSIGLVAKSISHQ